jgi:hypothetical protein
MDPNTARYAKVARCVDRAADLPRVLEQALAERAGTLPPSGPVAERAALIEHLIGPRDGRASERIADALERRAGAALTRGG